MDKLLTDNQEFLQLLIFQGRYSGVFGIIVPHLHATIIRQELEEGLHTGGDYNSVINAEKLLTDPEAPYPGVQAAFVSEIVPKLENKIKELEKTIPDISDHIFNYLDLHFKNILER